MNLDECLPTAPASRGQVAAGFQVVGQGPGLVERPGVKRRDKLALVDEAVLEREQSENRRCGQRRP